MGKNIILIGMMGSGKSTIGKLLDEVLVQYKLVDIDEEIEKNTQSKISEIFLKHGEHFFRMLETEKIKSFCKKENLIISAGGGAFEADENRKIMKENGIVLYLKASPDVIYERIKNEIHRPLLKKNFSVEKIKSILKLREVNYKKADYIIDTSNKEPYNVVQEILRIVNDRNSG